tara:strand:+ start:343 stop:1395 length:1053 start_codon:yes stop_codon:yes gene_type:complete
MDELNISSLSEAKGEYSVRLVNILTPYILEGVKSIFDSAKKLCIQNDEYDKYLMTFQNLLARVVNWNDSLISEECKRVVNKSQCNYIPELISCVHITQVKILTSVKLGNACKKISIEVPTINKFLHNVYIKVARKIYSNVYLFEENILPLTYQKYMRECELIIQQSILDVIRDGLPVESILRSYLNDIEEDVEEEVNAVKTVIKEEKVAEVKAELENSEIMNAGNIDSSETTSFEKPLSDDTGATKTIKKVGNDQTLSFNNTDKIFDMGTNKENDYSAPKDVNTLETISNERHIQRKIEEAEEEAEEEAASTKINIIDTPVKLDEIMDLNKIEIAPSLIPKDDIEILTPM